ncbi:MAG: response regulator [Aeromicrobium sp.]|nr:response regulator [Burkholderiales bacterium]
MSLTSRHAILVVDDDHAMRDMLVDYLKGHGLLADGAATANEADAKIASGAYGLVLLDLGLPDGDGLELARRWKGDLSIAIICITGRNEEADRVMGLELGADDYMTKPFSLREMLARMRAVMRRAAPVDAQQAAPAKRGTHPRSYRFAGWALNVNTRRLLDPAQTIVALTNAEFNLLTVFLGAASRSIISREQLLEQSRAFDDIYDRAIDVQILRLRRKLEIDPKKPALLRTERGAGYFLDADVESVW